MLWTIRFTGFRWAFVGALIWRCGLQRRNLEATPDAESPTRKLNAGTSEAEAQAKAILEGVQGGNNSSRPVTRDRASDIFT
jgi:hypothetical protein